MNIILYFVLNYIGFVVSPSRVDKAIYGAEQMTEVFEVVNFANDSLRIKIELEDFEINDLAEVNFLPGGTLTNSLAPLATINPEEFTIGPQEVENIRITFRMPAQTKIAEYYSMLIFKSQPIPTAYHPMIAIAGEIGVPIYYANAELAGKSAVFENLAIVHDTILTTLRNNGNIHLRVNGESRVLGSKGNVIAKDSVAEFVLFPGKIRRIAIPLMKTVPRGDTCLVQIRLDYGVNELIEAERRFVR